MASPSKLNLLFFLIWAAMVFQGVGGSRTLTLLPYQNSVAEKELHLQNWQNPEKVQLSRFNIQHTSNVVMRRRSMIGSVMPTCTYNECRGCRTRCRAEQVPVEGNDPINSAYHYRCVCHR